MLRKLRTITKQKGQGIVEYAVLLAFIVGLATMLMSGGGIKGAVKDTFDSVASWLEESRYDLNTPEGRLAADKARIKKLGEALAKNFKHNDSSVTDTYDKTDNPTVLKEDFVNIVVLPDGTLDVWFDGAGNAATGWHNWYSKMNAEQQAYYNEALKGAGIDLTSDEAKTKTFENTKLYSAGDEGELKNGYAISFTKDGSNMTVKYYKLNNPYTKDDLGTSRVPRDRLSTGESNTLAGEGYSAAQTQPLSFTD